MSLIYVYIAAAMAIALIIGVLWSEYKVHVARRQGIYPAKGKTTMEDVKRLALSGDTGLAMRAYRELYGATPRKAKEAVDQIASSSEKTEVSP